MRTSAVLVLVLMASTGAACAGDEPPATPVATSPASAFVPPVPVPAGMSPELLRPLPGLPRCEPPPPGIAHDVPGLHLPPEATVLAVSEDGPLVEVTGFVALTPVQLRAWFQTREGLEVIHVEDEVRESESLVFDGTYRQFVQALAACSEGSRFTAVIAAGEDADAVPTPTGTPIG